MMTAELIIENQLKRIKKNAPSKNYEENTDLVMNGFFNQRKLYKKTLYVNCKRDFTVEFPKTQSLLILLFIDSSIANISLN